MSTPFDRRILWWHWRGSAVAENTIADLAHTVCTQTPNVAGIVIKTSNGAQWQGDYDDDKPALAITGPASIQVWVTTLQQHDLETHLWCVVHGQDIAAEAQRIIDACHVPGVKSLILDVEAGERYFGSQPPEAARALITRVRAHIPPDFHLVLCLFVQSDEPDHIHINEWLPHIHSLPPMVYHWDFSPATSGPRPYLNAAFARLAPYRLPLVPILGTYPDPHTGQPVPAAHLTAAGRHAFELGAAGISYFRFGSAADGCSGPTQYAAIRRLTFSTDNKLI